MNLWINKIIVDWETHSDGGEVMSSSSLTRTYELWEHAENILLNHKSQDYLSDTIINLNKAIGLRIIALNENYHFTKSPFKTKDRKILGQLEEFGVIRPRLLNEITKFRNNIEHNDSIPPTYRKCLDYLEICWYFLKATDLHVLETKHSIVFTNPTSDKYWVNLEVNFSNNWTAALRGWLPPKLISATEVINSIKINSKEYQTRAEFINSLDPKYHSEFDREDDARGKDPNDIVFFGFITEDKEGQKNILTKYFKTVI